MRERKLSKARRGGMVNSKNSTAAGAKPTLSLFREEYVREVVPGLEDITAIEKDLNDFWLCFDYSSGEKKIIELVKQLQSAADDLNITPRFKVFIKEGSVDPFSIGGITGTFGILGVFVEQYEENSFRERLESFELEVKDRLKIPDLMPRMMVDRSSMRV